MRRAPAALIALCSAAAFTFPSATSHAQASTDPMMRSSRYQVTIATLHPDRVGDWLAVQRNEIVPALKKAGVPSRIVTRSVVGTNYEFTIVTPFPRWEALDGPSATERALGKEGAARVVAKLEQATQARRTFLVFRQDSLSLPSAKGVVWRASHRRYLPGKRAEFNEFFKNEALPSLRKAMADGKIAGSSYAWGAAGAESGDFWLIETYPNFAAQDGGNPYTHALGADGAAKFNEKMAMLSTSVRLTVSRVVPELSW